MKVQYQKRINKQSIEGKPVQAFGLRFGYWPCKKAPFIQIGFMQTTHEVWIA